MKIKLPVKDNPQQILEDVQARLKSHGGTCTGTCEGGTFSVMGVKGSYAIEGQELVITITKKPFFVPESFIQDEISSYFNTL